MKAAVTAKLLNVERVIDATLAETSTASISLSSSRAGVAPGTMRAEDANKHTLRGASFEVVAPRSLVMSWA